MNKNTIRRFASCAAMVAGAILPLCAEEVAAEDAAFASAPMLIPAPREMTVTGGSIPLAAADSPKVEVVAAEHRRRLVREHVNCAPLKGKAAG